MKKVAFHNLGCKVNSYELDVVQQKFVEKGYKIVPFDQIADIYIVNTCTVTNIADRKSRQMLHQAKKKNEQAVVVALGCYVQTAEENNTLDDSIDLAIGNNKKKDTVEIVEDYLLSRDVQIPNHTKKAILDINHTNEYEEMELTKTAEHTRAYIKIQDGCNQFCTYCIIPFARGRVRSRKPSDIENEICHLVEHGYSEFVLTGIHIGSYGVDFSEDLCEELLKETLHKEGTQTENHAVDVTERESVKYGKGESLLLELILRISRIEGVKRIRLGSMEPQIVTDFFAKTISQIPAICPHFHLSLQSGCDATLKRMNRKYTTAQFKEGVKILRKYFDRPAITTDVITGFPGETEEEFEETKAFLEEIHFFEMHIFPYSVRKGTVAADMENQVDGSLKKSRSKVLDTLEKKQSKEFRASFLGETEEILLEEEKEILGKQYMIGHTKRYVKVAVPMDTDTESKLTSGAYVSVQMKELLTEEIVVAQV